MKKPAPFYIMKINSEICLLFLPFSCCIGRGILEKIGVVTLSLYLSVIEDEGQRRKFKEIYIKYRQAMFYQAQIILCNEADAEDVVHTVFT